MRKFVALLIFAAIIGCETPPAQAKFKVGDTVVYRVGDKAVYGKVAWVGYDMLTVRIIDDFNSIKEQDFRTNEVEKIKN